MKMFFNFTHTLHMAVSKEARRKIRQDIEKGRKRGGGA